MLEPKPIHQAKKNDCFNACLAMLLGLELQDVPEFAKGDAFYGDARIWLHSIGWDIFYQDVEGTWDAWSNYLSDDHYLIGQEQWPSGSNHAFILKGSERFFDPTTEPNDGKGKLVGIYFLMPMRPFIE